MKTLFNIEEVSRFLGNNQIDVDVTSISPMVEGHSSQVFRFAANDGKLYVLRIRENEKDLRADKYAYEHFSSNLPLPIFVQLGRFDEASFYCITEYIQGRMLNTLNEAEFQEYLPAVSAILAKTFQMNISDTSGYGVVDFNTGNARNPSWKDSLKNELFDLNIDTLRLHAKNINLPDDMVDRFVEQFNNNLPYVSEVRRLLHGDPGGDNVLVASGGVTAVVDWEQMTYGDWMRDFARLSFWYNNSYGHAKSFANAYNLEAENIKERTAVY